MGEGDAGRDSTGNGYYIWFGNMIDLDSLKGNGTWDSNRDINVVFLYVQFWDNVGDLRSVSGVGSEGISVFGLNNGVGGSRSSGTGAGGMAAYGAEGAGMTGAGRASVSIRFWVASAT